MWLLFFISGLSLASEQSLLFIGNSYTSFNNLNTTTSTLFEQQEYGWDPIQTAALTQGGFRWTQHEEALNNPSSQHHAIFYGSDWDWVILQEQSQIAGFPNGQTDLKQSLTAITALNERVAALPAETVLFMTWGRRDGDSGNPSLYPDFETMNDLLDQGYRTYRDTITSPQREVWIAPVGRVFQHIYDRCEDEESNPLNPGSDFHRLYSGDGSHPSVIGTAVVAATFYATITGRPPSVLAGPPDVSTDVWLSLTSDVEQVVAANSHGDIPYPWALRWENIEEWTSQSILGGGPIRPHLLIDSETPLCPDLQLFDSRLEITTGGALHVENLVIDSDSFVTFDDGLLTKTQHIDGDIEQLGGRFEPAVGASITGDYSLGSEASLALNGGKSFTVSGAASLSGTLELSDDFGPGAILIEAGNLSIDGLHSASPDHYSFVLEENVLKRDGEAPVDFSEPGLSSGCACRSSQPGKGSWLPFSLLILLLIKPRRQRRPIHL